MRVEIKDVDPRDMETFIQCLQRMIEYDPITLADSVSAALIGCDSSLECVEQDGKLYVIKGE